MVPRPGVLAHRPFTLYLAGVALTQVGSRATIAASVYHVYELTGSITRTGVLGGVSALGFLLFSPLGGILADRYDRRRVVQVTQLLGLLAVSGLAWSSSRPEASWVGVVVAMFAVTATTACDQPARQALLPALVPRVQLQRAVALVNPTRELAVLSGPAIAGVLIALGGPQLVYTLDAVTYAAMVVVVAALRPSTPDRRGRPAAPTPFSAGVRLALRPGVMRSLVLLDLCATILGAYRVVLPAIARDTLQLGSVGYGLLAAAPSAGALLVTYPLVRRAEPGAPVGLWTLRATAGYGAMVAVLGLASVTALVVLAAVVLGACDAITTSVRHAAVQLETPDHLRGRVSSAYQMASRGGPALGDLAVGFWAGLLGPAVALGLGGGLVVAVAVGVRFLGTSVRSYVSPRV